MVLIPIALVAGCADTAHHVEGQAQAQALCIGQQTQDAGFHSLLLGANPTTAGKAAAAFASAGLPMNDWDNLPASTFVAACRYKVLDGPVTYWFVARGGHSSLAPPSVSAGPTSGPAG